MTTKQMTLNEAAARTKRTPRQKPKSIGLIAKERVLRSNVLDMLRETRTKGGRQ